VRRAHTQKHNAADKHKHRIDRSEGGGSVKVVKEAARRGRNSRSRTLPARMYRRWAAALAPGTLTIILSQRLPWVGASCVLFPWPLVAPTTRPPLGILRRIVP